MRYGVLGLIMLLMVVPASAQQSEQGNLAPDSIFALVDGQTIVSSGAAAAQSVIDLSAIELPEGLDYRYEENDRPLISPDGTWLAFADDHDHLGYGPVSGSLSTIPAPEGFIVSWAMFSPDSRYLSYTFQSSYEWILGLLDLSSGRHVDFRHDRKASHDHAAQPFHDFIPQAREWSQDGHRIYFVTCDNPMLGCYEPHYLYAMDVSALNFDDPNPALPPVWNLTTPEYAPLDWTYSPDMTRLAYVYHNYDEESGDTRPNKVMLVDLTTGENRLLFEFQDSIWPTLAGWNDNETLLYYVFNSNEPVDASPETPYYRATLVLLNVTSSQSETFPLNYDIQGNFNAYFVETAGDTVFFLGSTEADSGGVYGRSLSDPAGTNVGVLLDEAIYWYDLMSCGNRLYIVVSHVRPTRSAKLYSVDAEDATAEPALLMEAETIDLLTCGNVGTAGS